MEQIQSKAQSRTVRTVISSVITTCMIAGVGVLSTTPAHATPATVNVTISCTADTEVTAAPGDTLSFSFASNCAGAPALTFFNWKSLGATGYLDTTNRPAGSGPTGGSWYYSSTASTTFSSEFSGFNGSGPISEGDAISMITPDQNAGSIQWYYIKWLGAPPSPSATPTITTQPADATLTVGDALSLSVIAAAPDSGTLSYVWKKDSQTISGETSAMLTIASVGLGDAGSYEVVVTNTHNSDLPVSVTSSAAIVTVNAAQTGGGGSSGGGDSSDGGEESQSTGSTDNSSVVKVKKSLAFGSGASSLTPAAKKAIKAAVKKSGKSAKYTITGAAGSVAGVPASYTKNLAKLRAKAVKAYLVKLGVKKSSITIKTKIVKSGLVPKTKLTTAS